MHLVSLNFVLVCDPCDPIPEYRIEWMDLGRTDDMHMKEIGRSDETR